MGMFQGGPPPSCGPFARDVEVRRRADNVIARPAPNGAALQRTLRNLWPASRPPPVR